LRFAPGPVRPVPGRGRKIAKNIALRRGFWLYQALAQTDSTSGRRRLTVFYHGRMQGVGFRYTVKTVAAGFEVTGAIRNLPDGRVELAAEGRRDELTAFQAAIREAGLAGFIALEELHWENAENKFRGFEITG